MAFLVRGLCAAVLVSVCAYAQTTQGLISGRILNSVSGRAIVGAQVTCGTRLGLLAATSVADSGGHYFLPQLTPGVYRVRVTASSFQPNEAAEVEVAVASNVDLDFRLRPIADVWEAGRYRSVFLPGTKTEVAFFGPDVDLSRTGNYEGVTGRKEALETSISQVIDTFQLRNLPLANRDVYSMLVTEAGVNADAGTARGLGLSIQGQRPSASNFLLDGLENNNYLLTGPLSPLAVEAIQEYRISTSNYSAEFGRTSGYVANAVTFTGSSKLHGTVYSYVKNTIFNANDFQRNLRGNPRVPVHDFQPGFQVTGPVSKERLTFSAALDRFRGRSRDDARNVLLPTAGYLSSLKAGSIAARLFSDYLPSFVAPVAPGSAVAVSMQPTSTLDRWQGLGRMDYDSANHRHRGLARLAVLDLSRPDFDWSPYKEFHSPLDQRTVALAVGHQYTPRADLLNEIRVSYSQDKLQWDRARPEVPTLQFLSGGAVLPGSNSFYPYSNRNTTTQVIESLRWFQGKHVYSAGGGYLHRGSDVALSNGRDGIYLFSDAEAFRNDTATLLVASIDRQSGGSRVVPRFAREYSYKQFFFFAQDAFRVARRVSVNYGMRYENFGSPTNVGEVKDATIAFGPGATPREQLRGASLVFPAAGNQPLFASDPRNFAGRLGFAIDLSGNGRTTLRGGYGIFYDRPFDNLWLPQQTNNLARVTVFSTPRTVNYLQLLRDLLPVIGAATIPGVGETTPPNLVAFRQDLRNPLVQSAFLGIQHEFSSVLSLSVNGVASGTRNNVATDQINRFTVSNQDRVTEKVSPNVLYRDNRGFSNYRAFTTVARLRLSRFQSQLSYTWSHTIDNQSDPLARSASDYGFSSSSGEPNRPPQPNAGFQVEGNWRGDKGNSDFDQRHNLVYFWIWQPAAPTGTRWAVLRGWTISQVAAFRSGFPFSVLDSTSNRAGLLDPAAVVSDTPTNTGSIILNRQAFSLRPFPSPDGAVRTGRNAFTGPGFYNFDMSVARAFRFPKLGESGKLTFRADAFNLLNHANLGNPWNILPNFRVPNSGRFGLAYRGKYGSASGFPSLAPLNETARSVQLVVRVEF